MLVRPFSSPSFSLKDFIRRGKVIAMYRSYLRKVKDIEDYDLRGNLKQEIRSEFRKGSNASDSTVIKTLLIEGERSLKKLDALTVPLSTTATESASDWRNQSDTNEDTKSDINGDDVRGRLGAGWPWDR